MSLVDLYQNQITTQMYVFLIVGTQESHHDSDNHSHSELEGIDRTIGISLVLGKKLKRFLQTQMFILYYKNYSIMKLNLVSWLHFVFFIYIIKVK